MFSFVVKNVDFEKNIQSNFGFFKLNDCSMPAYFINIQFNHLELNSTLKSNTKILPAENSGFKKEVSHYYFITYECFHQTMMSFQINHFQAKIININKRCLKALFELKLLIQGLQSCTDRILSLKLTSLFPKAQNAD